MSELFEIPETKSPRLQWIEDHSIKTDKSQNDGIWYAVMPREAHFNLSVAELAVIYWRTLSANRLATGKTEDEAITNLAKQLGLRLWNEGGVK
jgi:hypothetical protein